MAALDYSETGFSETDIHFARQTFLRDCPKGYCSKRKFLAFIRKCSTQPAGPKARRSNVLVQALIARQSSRPSRKFFSMMFDIYDRNHDGRLDFDEYIYALSALTGANRLRTVETLYNFFDINNQGFITRHEFDSRKKLAAQFLGRYQPGINDHLMYEQAFNTIDTNRDGRIYKEEFIQWHLEDHSTAEEAKPVKKRTRLLKNLTSLVDLRGQIKTTSLQRSDAIAKSPVDAWLETTFTINSPSDITSIPLSPRSVSANRHLRKILHRARDRFVQSRHPTNDSVLRLRQTTIDSQSDSGVFTSSSVTNFNDDADSDSLLDTDEDYLQSINTDDPADELLRQSLEAALMETLIELRAHRQRRSTRSDSSARNTDKEQALITRL